MSASAVDVGRVFDVLRRHCACLDSDVIFIGGSTADGLATPRSDVDVFIIREIDQNIGGALHLVPLPQDEVPIDLEIWTRAEIVLLLEKFDRVRAELQTDYRAFMRLSEDERELLHHLTLAIPLQNEQGLARLQAQVGRETLARLSISRALLGVTNSQVDLVGWLAAGDWQSAGAACQKLVDFGALAMLGAAGCTHPGGKWLTRLLRRHFDGKQLPARLLRGASTLAERYYGLQLRPATADGIESYALDCVRFSNFSVLYTQTADVDIPDSALKHILSSPQDDPVSSPVRRGPTLSCEAQIRLDSGQWYLLHVSREMYEINATAAGMLLLLDGRTDEQGVVETMIRWSSVDRNKLAKSLRDLLMFLKNCNLVVSGAA